jgi:hypothetical protein
VVLLFVDWVAGIAGPARPRVSSPVTPAVLGQRGSTAEHQWIWFLWVKGFVDKACSVPQWHKQVLIAERVKDDHFGDRFREQLHRDGLGLNALHVLREVLMIEADVS